jgi:hypothetical protein
VSSLPDFGTSPGPVLGVYFSKRCCDIVSFKVRPSLGGTSTHPGNGLFGTTIVGEWFAQPNEPGVAPDWGIWWKVVDQHFNSLANRATSGVLPGVMRSKPRLGNVTFVGGTAVSRSTDAWYQVLTNYTNTDDDDYTSASEDQESHHFFGCIADFILDNVTMGYQGGTPSWSFTRRINSHYLEFELVLKRPCYSFLTTTVTSQIDVCAGFPVSEVPQIDGGLIDTREHFWRGRNSDG